ncbi:uncharacterized protein N7459_003498 [Penicillium hispanicum]|uniref:uncharacterized protein n=1 Tax=Penicillium hispanicum TaxID=1080232 RepID=UPI0025426053|nr:uncharacterized protein N7459_003498 [Penicillium hispanicum]KAJ5587733.1 hypothetical protein N7459_003498 [Penicillium hispanicum]
MTESQHSLLREEEDLVSVQPHSAWNPLGRSSPAPDYAYLPPSRHESFSDEVFREVGLGISNPSDEPIPHDKRKPLLSEATTTDFLKTPAISQHAPNCPTRATVLQRRFSWVPVTSVLLAFYATVFSGIYLVIAFLKPRWDNIGDYGPIAPSTANLLCAFFAKTIELAYVTISVAFLGQVLSRRALVKESHGISIADMSMRAWIMQPGSMIVHWESLRYSALTFLGAMALVATVVAMLYTTAAEALVSPKLSLGPTVSTSLWGRVYTSFANPDYLASHCETPISVSMDPVDRNTTCLAMEHVGVAYHNYQQWLTTWTKFVASGNDTVDQLRARPFPSGSIWDNTTVRGSWIEVNDITQLSRQHNRMVNNITMAMPHGGIPGAAMDAWNNIRQPQDASGEGKYNIEASVPSPAVNVLCVGMTESELEPLVYSSWPDSRFNATSWSIFPPDNIPVYPSWMNRTVVDPLFSFGEQYGQRPPVFGKFPEPNNTILNTTGLWNSNAIYLLGKPSVANPEYVMCAIRAKETGACSTTYNAASSGAFLSSKCENKTNPLQYNRQHPSFAEGVWSVDWKNIASEWASALNLGSGITNDQASNERLLMQMMPRHNAAQNTYSLDPHLPSIAEALAVMAGSTLILSTRASPFVQGWNYSAAADYLAEPVYQHFNAAVQAVGYASGGTERWQAVFYIILIFAFLTSAVCLGFMAIEARGHQITDFTEPQNLFALAVNSPRSSRLRGACGCGPVGRQLKERWFIGMEEEDEHYYIRAKADGRGPDAKAGGADSSESGYGADRRGRASGYSAGLDTMEMQDPRVKPVSPAVDEFRRVSKRGSLLARFY